MATPLKIGQLAKLSGKTARTLHFYEELGLLRPSGRTKGGFRLYSHTAVTRIRWIERLQDLGFSLTEIQDFLARLHEETSGPDANERLASFYQDKLAETQQRLDRLVALKSDLEDSVAYLSGCRSCDPLTPRQTCISCAPDQHDGNSAPEMVVAVHQS